MTAHCSQYGDTYTHASGHNAYATADADAEAKTHYGDSAGFATSMSYANEGATDTDSKTATTTYNGIADFNAGATASSIKTKPPKVTTYYKPAPKYHYYQPYYPTHYYPEHYYTSAYDIVNQAYAGK